MNRKVIEVNLSECKSGSDVIREIYKETGHLEAGYPVYDQIADGFIDYMREFPRFEKEPRPLEVHMILNGWWNFSSQNKDLAKNLAYCLTVLTDKKEMRYDDIDFTFSVNYSNN